MTKPRMTHRGWLPSSPESAKSEYAANLAAFEEAAVPTKPQGALPSVALAKPCAVM